MRVRGLFENTFADLHPEAFASLRIWIKVDPWA